MMEGLDAPWASPRPAPGGLRQAREKPAAHERERAHPDNPGMTASPAREPIIGSATPLPLLASQALANRPLAKAAP